MSDSPPPRPMTLQELVANVGGEVIHCLLQLVLHSFLRAPVDGPQLLTQSTTALLNALLKAHDTRPLEQVYSTHGICKEMDMYLMHDYSWTMFVYMFIYLHVHCND